MMVAGFSRANISLLYGKSVFDLEVKQTCPDVIRFTCVLLKH